MFRKSFFYLISLLILLSCDNKAGQLSIDKSKSPFEAEKELFFKVTDILSDEERLKNKLQEFDYSAEDVYEYCKKNYDIAIKTKFINYICKDAENDRKEAKEGFWGALRFNMEKFTQIVSLLKEDNHKTFMDIGSGNGEKLFASLCLGFEKVYGLEYAETNKKISEKFLRTFIDQKLVEIVQGDALKASPAYYAKADFAYMYSPMKDNEMMATLFKRVMDSLKEGSIFLEVRMVYFEELKKLTKLKIPQHKGWFAVKRQNKRFYYRTSLSGEDWVELDSIIEN